MKISGTVGCTMCARRQRLAVVLDLGAEERGSIDQQSGLVGNRLHAGQQQQPVALRQRI